MAAPHSGDRKAQICHCTQRAWASWRSVSHAVCHEHSTLRVGTHNILCKPLETLWRLGRKPLFDFRVVTELLNVNLVSSWAAGKLQFFLMYRHCVKLLKEIMDHPDTIN